MNGQTLPSPSQVSMATSARNIYHFSSFPEGILQFSLFGIPLVSKPPHHGHPIMATTSCHHIMPPHHGHPIMPPHHAMPSCHPIMPPHHATPSCHPIMPPHHATPSCHPIMPPHHATTSCHHIMPCHHGHHMTEAVIWWPCISLCTLVAAIFMRTLYGCTGGKACDEVCMFLCALPPPHPGRGRHMWV